MRELRVLCNGCPECIGCGKKAPVEVTVCDICSKDCEDPTEIGSMDVCWDCEFTIKEMIDNDEDLTEEYAAYMLSMGIENPINCRHCKQKDACKEMGDYPKDGFRKKCDGYEREDEDDG